MNEVSKSIQNHRSVRSYRSKSIDDVVMNDILTSGIRASTSSNMQFYSIIKTSDKKIKDELYYAHSEQAMILEAPIVLTFCCDQFRLQNYMKMSQAKYVGNNFLGFMRGVIDVCLVAQNIAIAAESHNLGICYMGSTLSNAQKISSILKLPKHVFPVTSLVVGHPEKSPSKKDRIPMEAILHENIYQIKSDQEYLSLYKEKEETTFKRFKEGANFKKLIEEEKLENISQVYTRTKFEESYLVETATKLKEHYFEQGFEL